METATLYTLNSKIIPIVSRDYVRMECHQDLTPIYIKNEPCLFTLKTIDLPLHTAYKSVQFSEEYPMFSQPMPWKLHDSRDDGMNTYYHLFAVEPELERILRCVFNDSELERELGSCKTKLCQSNNKNLELQKERDILKEKFNQAQQRINRFKGYGLIKRIWFAIRNENI
jgi:hypothetical protein